MARMTLICLLSSFFLSATSWGQESSKNLIPETVVSNLLKSYTEVEKTLINEDLRLIQELSFRAHTPAKNRAPLYIGTAGGPLSRKTTILEKILYENAAFEHAVYLDPDPRALKFMVNTYIARSMTNLEIYKTQDIHTVRRNAYNYWRDASNFITNTLLNEAFQKRFDIAHGTTLTGPASSEFLRNLKDSGYQITLLLAFAPDSFKEEAGDFRDNEQGFYQATSEDIIEKGKLFPQRIKEYFFYADHIQLFWSEKLTDSIQPAALWSRTQSSTIIDPVAYGKIVDYYTKFQTEHPDYPCWDNLFKKKSKQLATASLVLDG